MGDDPSVPDLASMKGTSAWRFDWPAACVRMIPIAVSRINRGQQGLIEVPLRKATLSFTDFTNVSDTRTFESATIPRSPLARFTRPARLPRSPPSIRGLEATGPSPRLVFPLFASCHAVADSSFGKYVPGSLSVVTQFAAKPLYDFADKPRFAPPLHAPDLLE